MNHPLSADGAINMGDSTPLTLGRRRHHALTDRDDGRAVARTLKHRRSFATRCLSARTALGHRSTDAGSQKAIRSPLASSLRACRAAAQYDFARDGG